MDAVVMDVSPSAGQHTDGDGSRPQAPALDGATTDPASHVAPRDLGRTGLPVLDRRNDSYPSTTRNDHPIQLVVDSRLLSPAVVPRSMVWTPRNALQVLTVAMVFVLAGLAAGWLFGSTKEPESVARSEFIFFLEDAMPDGFLREDRRILTQLVTIESESSLRPIAEQFDTTVKDLRKQLDVHVVDLSEVIRLDVADQAPDRALAINQAILAAYQEHASSTDRRSDLSGLVARRDAVLAELEEADQAAAAADEVALADVALEAQEQSLARSLEAADARVERLSAISDGLLDNSVFVDDQSSINSQLQKANQLLAKLEAELIDIRSERVRLRQAIVRQLDSESPYAAADNQQRDAELSVSEDSTLRQIETISQSVVGLEAAQTNSFINNEIPANSSLVDEELAGARASVIDLEQDLLDVSTQRSELAQSVAIGPSVLRRIDRLEQDLTLLDAQLASLELSADRPLPVEVLTEPVVLAEPASNPKITWSAIGFLAALPLGTLAAASVRARQRRRA